MKKNRSYETLNFAVFQNIKHMPGRIEQILIIIVRASHYGVFLFNQLEAQKYNRLCKSIATLVTCNIGSGKM